LIYRERDYPDCGWPSVSPDGTRVLFHRCPPEGRARGRVVVVDIDGRNLRDLCDGVQPSWSADGEQFVCARLSGGRGVWIMNASGRSGQPIAEGWAPKWSPDGTAIAYLRDNGAWIYDIARRQSREVWRREDHRYQDLGEDIAWSPDGERIALLAHRGARSELVILHVGSMHAGSARPRVRSVLDATDGVNLNWIAELGIVFRIRDAATGQRHLVSVGPDEAIEPRRFNRLGALGGAWKSAGVTPDRKWYIAVSEK
jgi:hypothetical protein